MFGWKQVTQQQKLVLLCGSRPSQPTISSVGDRKAITVNVQNTKIPTGMNFHIAIVPAFPQCPFLREIKLYKGDKYSLPHRDILRLKWYLQYMRKCYHGKCLGCSSVTGAPVSLMNVLQGKLRSNIWRDNWTRSAYFWHFVFIVKIKARCSFLRISSAVASFPFSVSYSTQMT